MDSLRTARWLVLVAAHVALATAASAASINYGSFGPIPPGIAFEDVTESSTDPVPLYGPPDPFAIGLDFDPIGFVATATDSGVDLTDGQLNFLIRANPGIGITSVSLFEAGDYTLAGAGTSATQAVAGAILRAVVTQIDGVDVAPVALIPVNASVGFNLAANPGVVQPWSLGLGLNVAAQLQQQGLGLATVVEIVVDNSLVATAERATAAFIAKKDFRISLETVGVPEPGTLALVLGGLAALARRSR
jgi:hypothetical protein